MFRPSAGKFAYVYNISQKENVGCIFYNGSYKGTINTNSLTSGIDPISIGWDTYPDSASSLNGMFLDDTDGIGASNSVTQHFNYVLFDKPTS
jgi:hypothetical protein